MNPVVASCHDPAAGRRELLWAVFFVVAGLAPRLLVAAVFPTQPVSDFSDYVALAEAMAKEGWAPAGYYWDLRCPGLPSVLALLSFVFPGDMVTLGRWATAIVTGTMPVMCWMMLRGALPVTARATASSLLAVWPGQILTAGVISTDNWATVSCVALASLAARAWLLGRSYPWWAAVLFAGSVWIRQEMLVVLAPLALLACVGDPGARRRSLIVGASVATALLVVIALQRQAATGRFALTTESKGGSLAGGVRPAVYPGYWGDPFPWLRCKEALREPLEELDAFATRMAIAEIRRRPTYHGVRAVHAVVVSAWHESAGATEWALAPTVLPAEHRARGLRLHRESKPITTRSNLLVHGLALAALLFGASLRSPPILAIAAAILLKGSVHLITTPVPRYFVVTMGLEIVLIAVGVGLLSAHGRRAVRVVAPYLLVAFVMLVALSHGVTTARGYLARETEPRASASCPE